MNVQSWFFEDWAGVLRVLTSGTLIYITVVFLLRISGKRTLSKMNAFDLVVTVALGSTLASITVTQTVALLEGTVALLLLITAQFVITWLSVRSETVNKLVKSEPAMLLYNGQLLHDKMRQNRVVRSEVDSAIRAQGITSLDKVQAVVLETDGSFTVMPKSEGSSESALGDMGPEQSH